MSDTNTLTPDEQTFFETGELPTSLQPAPIEAAPEPTPTITAAPEPPLTATPPDALEHLRQSLAAEQRRAAEAEARLNLLESQRTTPEIQAPNPEIDPLGAMMHQLNSVNKTVQDLQSRLFEQQNQAKQVTEFQSFQASMRQVRDEFVKTTPDFPKAYDHLRATRAEDLRLVGLPEDNIQQALMQDDIAIAQNALKSGKNPAEVMYNMAKRHGYASSPIIPATQKISTLQTGVSTSKPIQSASPPAADISNDGLKNASNTDLDAMVRDDKVWAKLTGKPTNDIFH